MAAGEGGRGGRTAEDPWRAADALLAAGRLEEAAHALYRAVVESVTRTEKIRLDPSKTSGDYVRELRSRGSPRTSSFRDFSRRFDVAVYGHGGCDAGALTDLARLAEPFRPERARGVRAA